MADISKDQLRKEISAILKDADLTTISSKKVRQQIEEKLDIDLISRKKEVDELVLEYIDKKDKGKKKNGKVEEDEDPEDEDDEDAEDEEDESEEEEKKPKRAPPKKAPAKRTRESSSEESEEASDDDDEYSPKKKPGKKPATKRGRKKKTGTDDDSDEDWGKGKRKVRAPAKSKKKPGEGGKRGGGGYTKPVSLSSELAAIVGQDMMPRHEVVKRIWAIIKERNLYDPKNKQFAICDDELLKVFGVKRFRTFGMMKFLKNHFKD